MDGPSLSMRNSDIKNQMNQNLSLKALFQNKRGKKKQGDEMI